MSTPLLFDVTTSMNVRAGKEHLQKRYRPISTPASALIVSKLFSARDLAQLKLFKIDPEIRNKLATAVSDWQMQSKCPRRH